MADRRNIWAILGSVALLGGGPLLLASEVHYPALQFWVCWLAVIVGFSIFATLVLGGNLPGLNRKTLSITHCRTFGEIKAYALPTFDTKELNEGASFVDIVCRCFVAVPMSGEPITITSAKAKIELYEGEVKQCDGLVHHTIEFWKKDGYRDPPDLNPGETLKVDCSFLGHLHWDNGWIMPDHPVIHDLAIVDQFGTNHRLKKDIDFYVSWVSTPPSS